MHKKNFLIPGMMLLAMAMAAPANAANWAGPYVGVNAGYGWGNADTNISPLPTAAAFANLMPTTIKPKVNGAVAGGQVGYNWVSGNWVYGLEADMSWSGMKDTVMQTPIIQNNGTPWAGTLTVSQKITSFGTLRGRIGQDVGNNVLIFGSGGLAWGTVKTNLNSDFRPQGNVQYPASQSKTKLGWTLGGGVEWAFNPTTTFKVEYLYVNLGKQSITANPVPANPPFQVYYDWKAKAHIVRAGVNFLF